jgi:hypothetical protein
MEIDWNRMYRENIKPTPLSVFGFNPVMLPEHPSNEYIISTNLRSEINTNANNMSGEIWKLVPYDDIKKTYASNYGRIKNEKGKLVKATNKNGRLYVRLAFAYEQGGMDTALDKIIFYTFTGNDVKRIIHIDGNSVNNRLDNLTFKS